MAAALASAVAAVPLVYLGVRLVGVRDVGDTIVRAQTLELVARSLALAAAVCGTCLVVGVTTAWVLTHVRLPGGRLWLVASALPLAVPSYVAAFGWIATIPGWSGFVPAWLVLSAVSVPYVTLPVAAALRSADPGLAEVARSLGSSPWHAWRTATLPQVAPAAAAGTLLVGLYVLSDFGAVAMLRLPVFTFAIQQQYASYVGRDAAVVLAAMLVVIAMALVVVERLVRGRGERWRVGAGASRPVRMRPAGPWAPVLLGFLAVAPAIAVVVPVVALFRRLAEGTGRTFDVAEVGSAVATTAAVSAAAAAVAVALALPIGLLAARFRGRTVATVEAAGFTGHALPGIVVALSLVFLTLQVVPGLYQTATMLVLAYVVLFLPKAIGATRTSVGQVSPRLAEVARSHGRGPVAAQASTTWRLAAPGVAAGALLVMLTAMKELPATLLLRPTGLDTLATEIWTRTSTAAFGAAAPYALALLAVAAVPAFLLTQPDTWGERS